MSNASAIMAGAAFVSLSIKDSLTRDLGAAQKKIDSFAANAGSVLNKALVVAAPAAQAAKTFSEFDDQMRLVQGVTGSTGEQFAALTETAKELGRTTSWTAAQVAEGMTSLGRAGFKSDEINASIGAVMNLARATGTEIGAATDIAGNALRAFNLPASEMGRVCDVLAATANGSAQTLEDLGEAFKYVAPIAASTGESLEDTAKTVGALANFGVKGSQAGTVIKAIQTRMASDAGAQATYAELGIDTRDAEGNLRKVHDVLADLGAALQNMPSGERLEKIKSVFGQYGLSGVSLTTSNFKELNAAIENSGGTAARVAESMDAGIGGAARKATSAVEGLAIAVGDTLAPHLIKLTDVIQSASAWLTEFTQKHPVAIEYLEGTAAAFIAVSAPAYAFAKIISGLISAWKTVCSVGSFFGTVAQKVSAALRSTSAAAAADAQVQTAANAVKGQSAAASTALASAETANAAAANANAAGHTRAATAITAANVAAAGAAVAIVALGAAYLSWAGSADKAAQKAKEASDAQENFASQNESRRSADQELFQELKNLAQQQSLTSDQFARAKYIAAELSDRYGNLGIKCDETSRKIYGMAEAQDRLNDAQKKQAIQDSKDKIETYEEEIERNRKAIARQDSFVGGVGMAIRSGFSKETMLARRQELYDRNRELERKIRSERNRLEYARSVERGPQSAQKPVLPQNVSVEFSAPQPPQVNVQPAPASDPAALAELQKQTEESRRQTAALRQIMTNTTPEDPDSDYL